MSEVIVGFMFSAGFAVTYLLISKLFEISGCAGFSRLFCRSAQGAGKSIAARAPKLFMTTVELSKHHSGKTGA